MCACGRSGSGTRRSARLPAFRLATALDISTDLAGVQIRTVRAVGRYGGWKVADPLHLFYRGEHILQSQALHAVVERLRPCRAIVQVPERDLRHDPRQLSFDHYSVEAYLTGIDLVPRLAGLVIDDVQ